jgi:hypothetical protein
MLMGHTQAQNVRPPMTAYTARINTAGLEHGLGQQYLQRCERVSHGNQSQEFGTAQIAGQQRTAGNIPGPVRGAEEQHQQGDLAGPPQDDIAPHPQPAAERSWHHEFAHRPVARSDFRLP